MKHEQSKQTNVNEEKISGFPDTKFKLMVHAIVRKIEIAYSKPEINII